MNQRKITLEDKLEIAMSRVDPAFDPIGYAVNALLLVGFQYRLQLRIVNANRERKPGAVVLPEPEFIVKKTFHHLLSVNVKSVGNTVGSEGKWQRVINKCLKNHLGFFLR